MKHLKEFILSHLKFYDDFECFLNENNINHPSIKDENYFIENLKSLYDPNCELVDYLQYFYERLDYSLDAEYTANKLNNLVDDIKIVTNNREDNVTLQFKVNIQNHHSSQFRDKLNSILNFCNWKIIRKEGDKKQITYIIEPSKSESTTKFVYEKCDGIIYRICKSKSYANKILKFGINPKIDASKEYKTYFLANINKEKIQDDINDCINSIAYFKGHKLDLRIVKIDLNKFKKNHNKTIQCFVDPKMDLKCYYTQEFIPPSCIEDVTNEFLY